MPLSRKMSVRQMVSEMINSYRRSGKIGNVKPSSIQHAYDIAYAIAMQKKGGRGRRGKRGS